MSERLAGIPEVSDKFHADGRFFVFAPEGSTQEQLNNLKSGGIVDVAGQGASVVRALAKHMAPEWPRRGSWAYFVDSFAAGAASSGIDEALIKIHTDYYFELGLKPSTREEDIIGLIRKYASAWQFLAILSRRRRYHEEVRYDISSIVVDSYNGESFLIWYSGRTRFVQA